jgi:hypothetical protein
MSFEIKMGPEGILRIILSGNMDNGMVENFRREYSPYINAATPENPLHNLFFMQDLENISSTIRHYLMDLNQDSRYGLSAYVKPSRRAKILGQLILKATQRENIHFFDQESEALEWLQLEK